VHSSISSSTRGFAPGKSHHGSGMSINSTRDGVKLEIKRTTGGSGNITCHMFVVANALMELLDSGLKSILY